MSGFVEVALPLKAASTDGLIGLDFCAVAVSSCTLPECIEALCGCVVERFRNRLTSSSPVPPLYSLNMNINHFL
jgi:hypothetical protein